MAARATPLFGKFSVATVVGVGTLGIMVSQALDGGGEYKRIVWESEWERAREKVANCNTAEKCAKYQAYLEVLERQM